jgi:hypothetical protein
MEMKVIEFVALATAVLIIAYYAGRDPKSDD